MHTVFMFFIGTKHSWRAHVAITRRLYELSLEVFNVLHAQTFFSLNFTSPNSRRDPALTLSYISQCQTVDELSVDS